MKTLEVGRHLPRWCRAPLGAEDLVQPRTWPWWFLQLKRWAQLLPEFPLCPHCPRRCGQVLQPHPGPRAHPPHRIRPSSPLSSHAAWPRAALPAQTRRRERPRAARHRAAEQHVPHSSLPPGTAELQITETCEALITLSSPPLSSSGNRMFNYRDQAEYGEIIHR